MTTLIFLLAVIGLGYWCTTAEDRARFFQNAAVVARHLATTAARKRSEGEPFREILRARTPWVVLTLALVALNVVIFVFRLFGAGALSDPAAVVAWGGNLGTRTTNGEWWRLVTSLFVHDGLFQLIINMAALAQIGYLLERFVGRLACAAVYFASGIFSGLAGLSSHPVTVQAGASGAIFGLYGLLLASLIWGVFERAPIPEDASYRVGSVESEDVEQIDREQIDESGDSRYHESSSVPIEPAVSTISIPLLVLKRMAPMAAFFVAYNLLDDSLAASAELVGLAVGFGGGMVLAKGVSEEIPPMPRVAATAGVAAVFALACAFSVRSITDVRPELVKVVAVEDRTARAYQAAADQFRKGRMTGEALAQVIDASIVPELQATDARLKALARVPQEHQSLVADAEEYVRLRTQSWHLRAEGIRRSNAPAVRRASRTEQESSESWRLRAEAQHRGNLMTFGKAEGTERASLEALDRIRAVESR
ncbi:MAG TPA: rhomboid family intramembrane serine protease [Vicinamibacterales bacterium]|jgi:membrane associated rhomboid family serine protease|nr:rhomboid family intramembrane serine protease [Vicinamibacterales bacterium]